MNGTETNLATNMQQIETLLADVEALPDASLRERVRQMIQTLLGFHAQGLLRIVEKLQEEVGADRSLLESLADDELVGSLLLLYDLHPTESADASFQRIELPMVSPLRPANVEP